MSTFKEPNFKNEGDESRVNIRSTVAPQCILDLPSEDQTRQPLTHVQYNMAKPDLLNKEFVHLEYPKTMKMHVDPPINGQYWGLFSFIPSKKATPDPQGCYGVLKIRGTFHDEAK